MEKIRVKITKGDEGTWIEEFKTKEEYEAFMEKWEEGANEPASIIVFTALAIFVLTFVGYVIYSIVDMFMNIFS